MDVNSNFSVSTYLRSDDTQKLTQPEQNEKREDAPPRFNTEDSVNLSSEFLNSEDANINGIIDIRPPDLNYP